MKKSVFFLLEFVVAGLLGVWASSWSSDIVTISSTQPLPFDHKIHRFSCTVCHSYAKKTDQAGIPGVETCMQCHQREKERKVTPLTDKIREFAAKGGRLKWVKFTSVPDHVHFSHKRHTHFGRVTCKECHGNIEQSTMSSLVIKVPTTDACKDCHEKRNVSNDCTNCHR
jgi:hypothetical protein